MGHTGIPLPAYPSAAATTASFAPTPPPSMPPRYPVAAGSVAQTMALKIEPLPCCGIGFGWFLFIIGFFLPSITWYVGAFIHLSVRVDPREKPGYVACLIAQLFRLSSSTATLAYDCLGFARRIASLLEEK